MRIILQTAPLSEIRSEQAGDWRFEENGDLTVLVADMGDDTMSVLIAFHEAFEALTCRMLGITDEQVTAFDALFEKEREEGMHDEFAECGDDPRAPYRREHFMATNLERLLAAEWGVDWKDYENRIKGLF